MKPTIIYIAGPMTGLPLFNYPAFFEAEKELEVKFPKAEIINPARNFGGATGLTHADYMRRCLGQVAIATHLFVLLGWKDSIGASWEVSTAKMLQLPIEYQKKDVFKDALLVVAKHYKISVDDLVGLKRTVLVCEARHLLSYWAYNSLELTYATIATRLSNRDHASVIHSCKVVRNLLSSGDMQFLKAWEILEPKLEALK